MNFDAGKRKYTNKIKKKILIITKIIILN